MELVQSEDLRWGFVHGDFHWGQMMYQDINGEILIEDWEFLGTRATPATDLATLFISSTDASDRASLENEMLPEYYEELIATGKVSLEDYTYEQLLLEYKTYGFS